MKIEVGMYIRTDNGIIEKINKIYDRHTTDNVIVWLNAYGDGKSIFIDDFESKEFLTSNVRGFIEKEPSFSITDLIEEGDYVNGLKVIDIIENDIYVSDYYAESYIGIVKVKDIKSIVTKEQMEKIACKVGE